ncbi:cupin family protein [Corynespora cassiicola Philippines]|uniref:Cupin family protein n=1 Tax=Corynespora cassiicola Philippines TaxID=1448308 RepID=A0A2T2P4M5_CORCC|nr:cupin family protein [Corynespora cassiicola Philippines]
MAAATSTRSIDTRDAQEIIKKLNLSPHPEKGWFIETYRDATTNENNRSYSTAIYYLLEGSVGASHWHRVDATEVWHYYAGAPLKLELAAGDQGKATLSEKILGPDVFEHQNPHVVIDKKVWQRASSLGKWTLVGCTVAPAFTEEGFEMSPPDWNPTK